MFDPVAKRTSHFMLEMDLGTMTVGRFIKKIQGYRAYWETGRHEIQYQIPAFQVLTVTTSEARLAHLLNETQRLYHQSRQFLFTTVNRYSLAEPELLITSPLFSVPASEHPTVLIEPVLTEPRQEQLLPLASWAPPLRQRVSNDRTPHVLIQSRP
ncbi:replication-relaxation family protein [Candidatus Acetothermia bacterium]|nr:replication-relaxation family protein [Candidatus Acetothermia bacterium]